MRLALAAACFSFASVSLAQNVGQERYRRCRFGPKGPEAGVWVIAETTDLPTKYAKVVVTDDKGRYLIPRAAEGATTPSGRAATAWRTRPRVKPRPGKTVDI